MTHVDGLEQLTRLSAALRTEANRGLRLELNKALRDTTADFPEAFRTAAMRLPKRGGLASDVAASRIRVVRRSSGSAAGITITATNAYLIGRMNRGRLRHRVWGGDVWVNQAVPPGLWDDPIREKTPKIKRGVEDALNNVGRRIGAAP